MKKFTETDRYRELKMLYDAMCFSGHFTEAEKVFSRTVQEQKEYINKVKLQQQGQ